MELALLALLAMALFLAAYLIKGVEWVAGKIAPQKRPLLERLDPYAFPIVMGLCIAFPLFLFVASRVIEACDK